MKNVPTFKTLILAAALAAGLSTPAYADDSAAPSAAPAAGNGHGLLGQNYANLGYHYTDFSDTGVHANAFDFALNQGIRDGVDTLFEYNFARTDNTGIGRLTQQQADVGARAYTNFQGFKPYVEAGLGWAWENAPVVGHENSFIWFGGVGAEFQVAKDVSATPLVRYSYANRFSGHGEWDYGVKANYWLTEKIGLQVSVMRDNTRDMSYGAGVNFRF